MNTSRITHLIALVLIGFKLIPGGFFSRNPALDVPR
jgi:Cu2+-containing amine oxidase